PTQEGSHELLVPMDLARAKPRVGRRALRIPIAVPAARRSLTTRDVRRLVDDQCFLPTASGRIGVEMEWLAICLADLDQPVPPELVGEAGGGLPAGSPPTLQPGGEGGLSSPPPRGLRPACPPIAPDPPALPPHLPERGIGLVGLGLAPRRKRARCIDKPRYEAMEAYFDAQGVSERAAGRTMMRSTAALQVNVDLGATTAEAERRWHRAHDSG